MTHEEASRIYHESREAHEATRDAVCQVAGFCYWDHDTTATGRDGCLTLMFRHPDCPVHGDERRHAP